MEKKPAECAKKGDLIPYYISSKLEPWHFNDITKWGDYHSISAQDSDPWHINEHGDIDATYVFVATYLLIFPPLLVLICSSS